MLVFDLEVDHQLSVGLILITYYYLNNIVPHDTMTPDSLLSDFWPFVDIYDKVYFHSFEFIHSIKYVP